MNKNGEKCQRCKETGEDRRMLWMDCFYAMQELKVPFKKMAIKGFLQKQVGRKKLPILKVKIPIWANVDGVEEGFFPFYQLRVCKNCRSEWMSAIEDWFNRPLLKQESCGSGIFIREKGALREITREEWNRRHGKKEPIMVMTKDLK